MRFPNVMVPVLSRSRTSTSPAASTARPLVARTFLRKTRSIPAMPIAPSSPPMVVGMRQTRKATSTGTGDAAVGDFTTLLLTVNPTLVLGVYPTVYTQFTATISGLGAGPNPGRIAFRYFVTSGGPSGANSDIISIDDVLVTDTVPVELMSYEID